MTSEPKDILKAERERRFKKAAEGARALSIPEGTYRSYENGHRPISVEAAIVIQEKWGIDATLLCPDTAAKLGIKGGTSSIEMVGELAVGVWSDNQVVASPYSLPTKTIQVSKSSAHGKRVAFRIIDESMNRLLKSGWYAIVEDTESDNPLDFPEGTFLVIERTRAGLTERSLRRLENRSSGKCELACYSTEKRYLGDRLYIPAKGAKEQISVIGRVVGGSFDL